MIFHRCIFQRLKFVHDRQAQLQAYELRRGRLEIEITEGVLVLLDDADRAIETLGRVREIGIGISVDDFGTDQRMPEMTGSKFFSCIKELHPDTVRILLSGYTTWAQ